jgi:hypothetical protein
MGRTVSSERTTIEYAGLGTSLTIESRKRKIPHANGSGFWWHTSYFVLNNGDEIKEKYSLRDAKEYAETLLEEV